MSYNAYRERNNALERNLPNLKFALHQQRLALEDIQSYIAERDKQMQEEMSLLLGHVKSSCELELQGRLLSRRNVSLTRSCKVFL